eukprot:m.173030 g.173030  ORF g.173030 m.173030 type:complete len:331 (-) comp13628_c0_seq1:87-1079(-)
MRAPVPPWTARPLLYEVGQASRRMFAPRFGRQLRLEPLDTDSDAVRKATQFHWTQHKGHKSLDLHLTIPDAVCVATTTDGQPRMPATAVLACFDHFSTYAISEADRTYRPGVSVTLSGTFADGHEAYLQPGRSLVMRCTVPKIGAAMSFASADVYVDKVPVAQLAHVKYMPLRGMFGHAWNAAFSPAGLWYARHVGFGHMADNNLTAPKPLEPDLSTLVALDNITELKEEEGLTASCGPVRLEQTNPLGDLHGGCQAMMSERLASQVARRSLDGPSEPSLQTIRMAYYRAGLSTMSPHITAKPGLGGRVVDTMVHTSSGAVLSEGVITWH